MYCIQLDEKKYEKFKREAKAYMVMQGLRPKDLCEKTGYPVATIYKFFSTQNSKFVAYAIAKALDMERWI